MPFSVRSYVLVTIQFMCLGWIVLTGPLLPSELPWRILAVLGGNLGCWALWAMQVRYLHVMPEVKPGSPFTTRGPYHLIRHPMYLALLLMSLAMVADSFTWWRGIWWGILCVDLFMKISVEEGYLIKAFPNYGDYQRRTWRLCPWIF